MAYAEQIQAYSIVVNILRFHCRNDVVYGEIIRQIFQLWQYSTHSFPFTLYLHFLTLPKVFSLENYNEYVV